MKQRGAGLAAGTHVQATMWPAEARNTELSQWFTEPKLARRIVEWAGLAPSSLVLEPSCGEGAFIAAGPELRWTGIDIDQRMCDRVLALRGEPHRIDVSVVCDDFLAVDPDCLGWHDAALMNPPYEGDADVAHILHAFHFTDRVIALLRSDFLHAEVRWERVWRHIVPARMVKLVGRPEFGSGPGPMSNFTIYDLRPKLLEPLRRGEAVPVEVEWW